VRAVNLIPPDQRRGSSAPGQTGAGVYVLLGGLAALLIAVGAYVLSANSIATNKDKLAKVTAEANKAEAQAAALKPYRDFASLSRLRTQTVSQLAGSRFDWETAIRQVSRVLPSDTWLSSFVGTVAPGVSIQGGSGGGGAGTGDTLRATQPVPAFELVGCTTSQSEVSRIMARLRRVKGVTRVTLSQSLKSDQPSASSTSGTPSSGATTGAGADCRYGNSRYPQFDIIAFFGSQQTGATPATPATGAATPVAASGGQNPAQANAQNTSQPVAANGAGK
jgi:Tfp pilus assembly protein PilN